MQFPSKEQVARQRRLYPAGTRIELIQMDDARGTVIGVDDTGSIMVNWDNGSGLNIIYGVDCCRKVPTND